MRINSQLPQNRDVARMALALAGLPVNAPGSDSPLPLRLGWLDLPNEGVKMLNQRLADTPHAEIRAMLARAWSGAAPADWGFTAAARPLEP